MPLSYTMRVRLTARTAENRAAVTVWFNARHHKKEDQLLAYPAGGHSDPGRAFAVQPGRLRIPLQPATGPPVLQPRTLSGHHRGSSGFQYYQLTGKIM